MYREGERKAYLLQTPNYNLAGVSLQNQQARTQLPETRIKIHQTLQ